MNFAINQYTNAILLNPSICFSEFWSDFSSRHPKIARKCVNDAICKLSPIAQDNPKRMARLGILYYKNGKNDKAWHTLESAANRLPNLNRVWLYLYFLEEDKNKRQTFMNRAIILDPTDKLSCYIKYGDKMSNIGSTDYENKTSRLYPYVKIEHNYLPSGLYGYIMFPSLLL